MAKKETLLRGHHLICLHFFQGEGYDQPFIKKLNEILARLKKTWGRVGEGPDELCLSCPHLNKTECNYKPGSNEEIEYLDKLALRLLRLKPGDSFSFFKIKSQLPSVIEEWERKACLDCDWKKVCLPLIGELKSKGSFEF